ncbi:coatomer protein subunit epsilon [Nannochloropsis gaditana]|uniref:Coatomer protein subunit epsilon n=1 Tax=Nannochloropsis gaditana TaxID=72520 RepID=W7TLM3_9STRA|nr:coatomer protein subunit epsilon [Nannochloropsis gaditana]
MEREDFRMQGERTVATPKTDNSLPYLVRSRHSHLPQLIPPGLFSRHFQSALQAVRWFAEYEAHPEQREAVVGKFQTSLQETATASCPSLQTMAAIIFLKEGLVKDALRAVHRGTTLEQ